MTTRESAGFGGVESSLRMRSASDTSEHVPAHAMAESAIEAAVLRLRRDG